MDIEEAPSSNNPGIALLSAQPASSSSSAAAREAAERRPRRAKKRPAESSSGYVKRVKVTPEYFKTVVKPFVKAHRPRNVSEEGKADIVHLNAYFRMKNESTRGRKMKEVSEEVARALGRDNVLVGKVWKEFVEHQTIIVNAPPVNAVTGGERARLQRTPELRKKIQVFFREQRENARYTPAITLLDFLIREGEIQYDARSNKARKAALRAVQRYIETVGFQRGTKKGVLNYKLSDANERKLREYLRKMQANREAPVGQRRRVISQDESYIHINYQRKDSLYDPEDDSDKHKKVTKDLRFCFIGWIVGPDLNVEEKERTDAQQGRFLMNSLDIFQGGIRTRTGGKKGRAKKAITSASSVGVLREWCVKLQLSTDGVKKTLYSRLREYEKTHPDVFKMDQEEEDEVEQKELEYSGRFQHSKKDTKDSHGMFDHDYMVQWMQHALADLKEQGIENALIVMDNAKYHKCLPKDIPARNAPRADIIAALERYEIPHDKKLTKPDLADILFDYIDKNVNLVLVDMAKKAGHELIFSPPHHSDLQAIEIIWAITKQEVARQYNSDTKKKDVYERLQAAFKGLGPRQVNGSFKKTEAEEEKMRKHFKIVEEAEEKAIQAGDDVPGDEEEVDDYGEGVSEEGEEEDDEEEEEEEEEDE